MSRFDKDSPMKILMLGEAACGKSNIVGRYKRGRQYQFYTDYSPTIIEEHHVKVCGHPTIIADLGGSVYDGYKFLFDSEIEEADSYLLCFGLDSEWSFQVAQHYLEKVHNVSFEEKGQFNATLVATKCDLSSDGDLVSRGHELAAEYGIPFIQCSARNDVNIDALFETAHKKGIDESAYKQSIGGWFDELWPLSLSFPKQLSVKEALEDSLQQAFSVYDQNLDLCVFFYEELLPFIVDMRLLHNHSMWESIWAIHWELPRVLTGRSSRSSLGLELLDDFDDDSFDETRPPVQFLDKDVSTVPSQHTMSSLKLCKRLKAIDTYKLINKERVLQCQECWKRFSWPLARKYNCQVCGHVFCGNCTKHRITLHECSGPTKQRICNSCWDSHNKLFD